MGRHSLYTPEIAETILERLENGESLSSICRDASIPDRSAILRWARDDVNGFSQQYARSREIGYQLLAEEIIEISDDSSRDVKVLEDGREITNTEVVARSRLRVDSRKWMLAKMLPKIYGEKLSLDHGGEVAVRDIPNDHLDTRITDLLRKGGTAFTPGGAGTSGD